MQMDQLMRADRLNFSLMACFPAALFAYFSALTLKASLSLSVYRRRAKRREEMRMLLHEAERALTNLKIAERRSVQQGMLIYALDALYAAVQRHQHLFTRDEWRSVRIDVLELADPRVPIDNKLVTVDALGENQGARAGAAPRRRATPLGQETHRSRWKQLVSISHAIARSHRSLARCSARVPATVSVGPFPRRFMAPTRHCATRARSDSKRSERGEKRCHVAVCRARDGATRVRDDDGVIDDDDGIQSLDDEPMDRDDGDA